MGSGLSVSEQRLVENDSTLMRLAGPRPLPPLTRFWTKELPSLRLSLDGLDPAEIQTVVRLICERMVRNNLNSRNFNALLALVCEKLGEVMAGPAGASVDPSIVNMLFLARILLKHFVENLTYDELKSHFDPQSIEVDEVISIAVAPIDSQSASHLPLPERLVSILVEACVRVQLNKQNYDFHLELIKTILVLFSSQMFASLEDSSCRDLFLEAFNERCGHFATLLCERLFSNFIRRVPHANFAPLLSPSIPENRNPSWWKKLGDSFVKMLLWPFQVYKLLFSKNSGHPLSDHSAFLLLVLTHQKRPPSVAISFRSNLAFLRDEDSDSEQGNAGGIIRISFGILYEALCSCVNDEWALLLLFSVLHLNESFCEFVYSRSDVDSIVLPLLHQLYDEKDLSSNRVYMILVILLMLTQDDSFSDTVHRRLVLDGVPWFKDRILRDISLGSLIMVVLLSTMQRNLSSGRDEYLHSNCLAAICNMAPHTCFIHEHTSQRLISLFSGLSRRYQKLQSHYHNEEHNQGIEQDVATQNSEDVRKHRTDSLDEYSVEEMATFGEFIRLLLQVLSNCLDVPHLPENISLLYALLHDQKVLEPFVSNELFMDAAVHVNEVLQHFSALLPEDSSVEEIKALLLREARDYRRALGGISQALPINKFSYEGLPDAELFFLPYSWQVVFNSSCIEWDRQRIAVFSPDNDEDELEDEDKDSEPATLNITVTSPSEIQS